MSRDVIQIRSSPELRAELDLLRTYYGGTLEPASISVAVREAVRREAARIRAEQADASPPRKKK